MRIINVLKNFPSKIKGFFKFLITCYRDGGVLYANIQTVNKGETLSGKRVLITGGGSGIGRAIAIKALSEGAIVIIAGRRKNKLDSLVRELNNPNLYTIEWDVSDISLIEEKYNEVQEILNQDVEILINSAGVLLDQKLFRTTEDVWDKTYAVNSKAVYFMCQHLSNIWIKKKIKGKIINVSSTSGFYGAVIPYGMTKWDIVGLTEGLGKELISKGIIVNGIAPGRTATEMLGRDSCGNIYDSYTIAKRFCLPEEIAELASFLMGDSSNFIVGQTILCDGGYTL
ncbi:SDR family NAD(P)-dependent oxidoreductase [Vibrio viridaestus]|uniref:SDR family oxidoreductase n=1 Tax=Vibrio viridaestus TaxID=2487322 RepID=A0A3N9TJ49_9VIBR|nr:SDR family oxidoreductase [Vibrio viridaestus]RQW63873.1 SDR family oxidoreductase [Vibrio viridaestus]